MLGFSFSFLRRKGSETEEPDEQGRKEERQEGKGEGRKEESKEGRHEHGRSRKRGNSLEILWKYSGKSLEDISWTKVTIRKVRTPKMKRSEKITNFLPSGNLT